MNLDNTTLPKRQNVLDLLRFLAIVGVVFAHYTDGFNVAYQIVPGNLRFNIFSRYAHITICLLFLMSGYVITMSSINKDLKTFFITRFSRLYPLFWISCIAGYLLPKISPVPTFLYVSNYKELFTNLTMLPFIFKHDLINPVFWTLIIEFIFYTFIAGIIYFKLWRYILSIITIVLVTCIFSNQEGDLGIIPKYAPFFMAGMLLYFIQVPYSNKWKLYSLYALALLSSMWGMKYLASELRPSYSEPHAYHTSIIVGLVIALFAGFLLIIEKRINLRDHQAYTILGDLSYPLYLFHIYWLGVYWYFRNSVQPQILLGVLIILMVITSWIIHAYLEKPFGRAVKRTLSYMVASLEKLAIVIKFQAKSKLLKR